MGVKVIVLPGDGVGPEVTVEAVAVLTAACWSAGTAIELETRLIGGAAIDREGAPVSGATLEACKNSDAVLLGAVGGPKWDHLSAEMRCEWGLLKLRRHLEVFANVRPVKVHAALASRSTLKQEVVEGVDMVVVRELTGGLYFAEPKERTADSAVDTLRYSRAEIDRVARFAFELARARGGKLTSVDKANVLVSSELWREVVVDAARDYPDVKLDHQLVDACAMRLLRAPRDFDVIVTENMFGDILTDEAAMLTGSLGMLPSASLGSGGPGLYEPIHGTAPDLAGTGRANPLGAIQSVAMMLEHSLQLPEAAATVRAAVDTVIGQGTLTPDLGGAATTAEVGAAVVGAMTPAGVRAS